MVLRMENPGSGADRYFEAVAGLEEFGQTIKGLLVALLQHREIVVHTIDHRVKTEQSARSKLSRTAASHEAAGYSSLHDLLGLRITCYFSDDINRIVKLIEDEFLVDDSKSVDKGQQLGIREFGYRSVHRVAQININRAKLAEYNRYKSLRFEIQIRTVVQHAWAEIEHDLGYKQETIPQPMSRRFSMLAGVLELVDYEFMALRDELSAYEDRANQAVKEQATDLSLDLATLTALLRHDHALQAADQQLAAFDGETVRESADIEYLEQQLAALRSIGVLSVTGLRQAFADWEAHIMVFAPLWMKHLDQQHHSSGGWPNRSGSFPAGVSFYYLWLVMSFAAISAGGKRSDERFSEPGASQVWSRTVEEVGEAPGLPLVP